MSKLAAQQRQISALEHERARLLDAPAAERRERANELGLQALAEFVLEHGRAMSGSEFRSRFKGRFGAFPPARLYAELDHPELARVEPPELRDEITGRRTRAGRPQRIGYAWLPEEAAREVLGAATR